MDHSEFIKKKIEAITKAYEEDIAREKHLRLCLYGEKGTGKTTTACTGRKPVYLQSFEPGGTLSSRIQEMVKAGDVYIDASWEKRKLEDPKVIQDWITEMKALEESGFFKQIGTFVVDSLSMLSEYLATNVVVADTKNNTRSTGAPTMQLQNYVPFQSRLLNIMKSFVGLPCDVVMIGHIARIRDDVTGSDKTGLNIIGEKTSSKITQVFGELWVTRTAADSKGRRYELVTQRDGLYDACTRLGDGIFSTIEKQDITDLLKKAGWPIEKRTASFNN